MFDNVFNRSPYLAIVGLYTMVFGLVGAPTMWVLVGLVAGIWSIPVLFVGGMFGIGFIIGNLSYLFNERWS